MPAAIFAAASRLAATEDRVDEAATGADASGPLLAWLWLGRDARRRSDPVWLLAGVLGALLIAQHPQTAAAAAARGPRSRTPGIRCS